MACQSTLVLAAAFLLTGPLTGKVWSNPPPAEERTATHAYDFWQESAELTFATRTADATWADLNGDGMPELIRLGIDYGNPYGGTLGITLGGIYGPQGTESQVYSLPSPRSVRAVDLNGDGALDLIAAHLRPLPSSPGLFVRTAKLFIQTVPSAPGRIEFLAPEPTVDLAPGGEIVVLCDVNGDQIDDLVSVGVGHELFYQAGLGLSSTVPPVPLFSAQPTNISKLAAQAAGLPPGSSYSFGFASDLVAGDFNGDGRMDIAVAAGSAIGGGLHIYFQDASAWAYERLAFTTPSGAPSSIASLAGADFNGDGLYDLAATSAQRELTLLMNRGSTSSPRMDEVLSPGLGLNAQQLVAADFNADGRSDLGWFDATQVKFVVAFNVTAVAAPSVFSPQPEHVGVYALPGQGLSALDATDVDGDGDPDLVASFLLSQSTSILQNEHTANASKPVTAKHLRGGPGSGALSDTFMPDALEFAQGIAEVGAQAFAADSFVFNTLAQPGERLRVRAHLRGPQSGVTVRLGLIQPLTQRIRWVHVGSVGSAQQELLLTIPDASRFISGTQQLELIVLSSNSGAAFRTWINQLSVEVVP